MSFTDAVDIVALQRTPILVADDDTFARKTLVHVLKKAGFEQQIEADCGERIIEILGQHPVSLLITDVQMPGWNGIETLRRIRAGESPAPRDLRVMVHTSFAHREVLAAAMALDVNGFLVKPIRSDSVRDKVTQALCERMKVRTPMIYSAVSTHLQSVPELAVAQAGEPGAAFDADAKATEAVDPGASRWVDLRFLMPGDIVAEDLRSVDGAVLLGRDTELTEQQINRLIELGGIVSSRRVRLKC